MQKPHPPIWFPGFSSPESVVWAASHRHPYMNLGSLLEHTHRLRDVYIDTARETGFQPGPEHFGYLLRVVSAPIPMRRRRNWAESSSGPRSTATAAPANTTTRPATSPARPSASSVPCREPAGLAA